MAVPQAPVGGASPGNPAPYRPWGWATNLNPPPDKLWGRAVALATDLPVIIPYPGVSVPHARLSQVLGLKGVLESRVIIQGVEGLLSGSSGYYGNMISIGDYLMQVFAYPGAFTHAELRPVLDRFMLSVGGHPTYPRLPAMENAASAILPEYAAHAGTYFRWTVPLRGGGLICYDAPGWYAQLLALTYWRGDKTVYAEYVATIADSLAWLPRSGTGCIYLDPAQTPPTYGFSYHDGNTFTGDVLDGSAWTAAAYKQLAMMAEDQGDSANLAAFTAARAALEAGIATLRQPSGWYNAGSIEEQQPDVWFSAFVASEGLCTAAEAAATGTALATEYLAGTITQRGVMRQLISPAHWVPNLYGVGVFQNGGYSPFFNFYALGALVAAGRGDLADQMAAELHREFLRQERVNSGATWEWQGESNGGTGTLNYGSGTAPLQRLIESAPSFVDVTLSAVNGSEAFLAMPDGITVMAARVTAGQASTLTVGIHGAPLVNAVSDPIPYTPSYGTEVPVLDVPLVAATSATVTTGADVSACVWGGQLRLVVSSGGGTGDLTVRLYTSPVTPVFVAGSGTSIIASDDYAADNLATNYTPSGTWAVTGGRLVGSNGTASPAPCLFTNATATQDCTVAVDITTVDDAGNGPFPGLFLRAETSAANDCVLVSLVGGQAQVLERNGGTWTSLGSQNLYTSGNGVTGRLSCVLSGQALAVTMGATTVNFTLTKTAAAGHFGPSLYASSAVAIYYDNFVVQLSEPATGRIPPFFLMSTVGSVLDAASSSAAIQGMAGGGGAVVRNWTGAVVAGPSTPGQVLSYVPLSP